MKTCTTCNLTKEDKSFKSKKGLKCFSCIHREFRSKNPEKYTQDRKREYLAKRSTIIQRKKELAEASFRPFLMHCLRKSKDEKEGREHNLTIDYVLALLKAQNECCALSGIKLTHKRNDLRAVSIDRIDITKGHVIGNIQLTCQFINMGRKNKSNEECLSILREIETNAVVRHIHQSSVTDQNFSR